ncbi:MAG TPA: sulfite exporter TauE/SafE family protein [Anaerolineae bacterium]|nr:sulfite exporter TauE/SafE family protein [Anaerolineae bacterium]
MPIVLIVAVVFAAALTQSLSGFGFALIIMPLVTLMVGLQTAAPMVALTALTVYVINVSRYRRAIDVREVLRLGTASLFGIPLGIWLLANVNEALVMQIMGLILIAYAAYALVRPTTSWVLAHHWVYPAGFLCGCLSGAYNTPGPPVIVYGSLRRWPRDEFRGVLQAIFLINGAVVVASHLIAGHVTATVLVLYLCALPAMALGILVGSSLDRKVDRKQFRTFVIVMVLVMGLALVVGVG